MVNLKPIITATLIDSLLPPSTEIIVQFSQSMHKANVLSKYQVLFIHISGHTAGTVSTTGIRHTSSYQVPVKR
jgi:hypothetical protein